MKKEIVELTNMCMIIDKINNKILVQNRLKNDWPGLTFPGGHVENGEGIIPSTIREIKEETGLDIKNLIPCGFVSWYNKENNERCLVFLFKTYDFNGKLINTYEGINKWMTLEEIKNGDMAPDFKEILSVFLKEDNHQEYLTWDPLKKNILYY